jgi:DNA-binding response OmpR family regulator
MATEARVLLLTDHPETGQLWTMALARRGILAEMVGSMEEALGRWSTWAFDLLIVDAHSPQLDSVGLCRQLRAEVVNPILLLTPQADELHLLAAYRAGVDECIVKPIGPALFLAKVSAWLHRSWTVNAEALDDLQAGPLRLDSCRRELVAAGRPAVKLSNLEFRLLYLLLSHPRQTFETATLLERVWGYTGEESSVALKNVVYRLRRKIEANPGRPRYIRTVAGVGYVFQPD